MYIRLGFTQSTAVEKKYPTNSVAQIIADTVGSDAKTIANAIHQLRLSKQMSEVSWEEGEHLSSPTLTDAALLTTTVDDKDDRDVLRTSFLGVKIEEFEKPDSLDKIDSFLKYAKGPKAKAKKFGVFCLKR